MFTGGEKIPDFLFSASQLLNGKI